MLNFTTLKVTKDFFNEQLNSHLVILTFLNILIQNKRSKF